MKIKIKLLGLASIIFVLGACENSFNTKTKRVNQTNTKASKTDVKVKLLVGSWLDVSESLMHFTLNADGTAHSDNMETYLYKKWELKGDSIIFTIESTGVHKRFTEKETLCIKKLNHKVMILTSNKGFDYTYARRLD